MFTFKSNYIVLNFFKRYIIATYLDPSYKKFSICADNQIEYLEKAKQLILETNPLDLNLSNIFEEEIEIPANQQGRKKNEKAQNFDLRDPVGETTEKDYNLELELRLYSLESTQHIDPIEYWSKNKKTYPILSYLANKYLIIPASSSPSERLFSIAGWQVSKLRSNLSPENVEAIIFLSENESFFYSFD